MRNIRRRYSEVPRGATLLIQQKQRVRATSCLCTPRVSVTRCAASFACSLCVELRTNDGLPIPTVGYWLRCVFAYCLRPGTTVPTVHCCRRRKIRSHRAVHHTQMIRSWRMKNHEEDTGSAASNGTIDSAHCAHVHAHLKSARERTPFRASLQHGPRIPSRPSLWVALVHIVACFHVDITRFRRRLQVSRACGSQQGARTDARD